MEIQFEVLIKKIEEQESELTKLKEN